MARDEMEAFGVTGDWSAARRHKVRWSECDALGHMNNTAYLVLCEDLRVGPGWSALGGRFGADTVSPVVAQMEARYVKALGFEDEVLVTLRFTSIRRTSFVHDYAIWKDGLCFECRTVLVAMRQDTGEKVAVPEAIRAQMLAMGAKDGAAG